MSNKSKDVFALYVRNFIFGVEDSLVSTVGLLSGIAVAGLPRQDIFITGIILIFVEALSMGAGSYLSEQSAEEYINHNDHSTLNSIFGAFIMFFSYFASGFIPLSPYMFLEVDFAFPTSISFSLVALLLLGMASAKYFKRETVRHGIRMLIIGGMAIGIGVLVGNFVHTP